MYHFVEWFACTSQYSCYIHTDSSATFGDFISTSEYGNYFAEVFARSAASFWFAYLRRLYKRLRRTAGTVRHIIWFAYLRRLHKQLRRDARITCRIVMLRRSFVIYMLYCWYATSEVDPSLLFYDFLLYSFVLYL